MWGLYLVSYNVCDSLMNNKLVCDSFTKQLHAINEQKFKDKGLNLTHCTRITSTCYVTFMCHLIIVAQSIYVQCHCHPLILSRMSFGSVHAEHIKTSRADKHDYKHNHRKEEG